MNVTLADAYREGCVALGEAEVRSRFQAQEIERLMRELDALRQALAERDQSDDQAQLRLAMADVLRTTAARLERCASPEHVPTWLRAVADEYAEPFVPGGHDGAGFCGNPSCPDCIPPSLRQ